MNTKMDIINVLKPEDKERCLLPIWSGHAGLPSATAWKCLLWTFFSRFI